MAETKRRLPPWMLKQKEETKVPSSDANLKPVEKFEDQIKEKHAKRQQRKRTLEEEYEDQSEEEPIKRKQRRKALNQDPDEFDEVEGALQRCQTRQRNSRGTRKHQMEIGEEKEGVKNKRAQKRRSAISDDETDLTVDDLVSIAEEYVNADKDKQEQQASATTTESGPAKNASKSLLGPRLTQGLLKCSTYTPSPDSSDYATSVKNNLTDNTIIPSNVTKIVDPAQEMLDLFLGPLLKKTPPIKEPTYESVEEVCSTSLVETCEKDVYKEEKIATEETKTFVKKKSSLKDKVSMFLT